MGIIDSLGDWVENTTSDFANAVEQAWTQEVRIEDTYDWLLQDHFIMDQGSENAQVQGPKPTIETVLQVLVDAYNKNDTNFDQLAANAVRYNLAPPDFSRDKVEAMSNMLVESGASTPSQDTGQQVPTVDAEQPDTTLPTTPSGQQWRANTSGSGTAAPTGYVFSERDIQNLMVQTKMTDIQQLLDVVQEGEAAQQQFDLPAIGIQTGVTPTPSQAKYMEEYGQRPLTKYLTPQQAVRYITDGKFTPSELINMQNKFIRAGYLDNIPVAMVPGDIMDPVTTEVFRTVLADVVRTGAPSIEALLSQKEIERSSKAVDLRNPQMRDILNNVAQQLMGRPLASTEMDGLVDYLSNIQLTQGAGMAENDLGQNVSSPDVVDYLYQETPNEIGVVGDALSSKSSTILKGFM